MTRKAVAQRPPARLKRVVAAIGWPTSSFFRKPVAQPRRPGPAPQPLDPDKAAAVREVALAYPWWGYKRLAVVCRRRGLGVSNRFVYRVLKAELLQREGRSSTRSGAPGSTALARSSRFCAVYARSAY